jgi:hypothetical protein
MGFYAAYNSLFSMPLKRAPSLAAVYPALIYQIRLFWTKVLCPVGFLVSCFSYRPEPWTFFERKSINVKRRILYLDFIIADLENP